MADLVEMIGAVKDRRIENGGAALSGVEGADASAMLKVSVRRGFQFIGA